VDVEQLRVQDMDGKQLANLQRLCSVCTR